MQSLRLIDVARAVERRSCHGADNGRRASCQVPGSGEGAHYLCRSRCLLQPHPRQAERVRDTPGASSARGRRCPHGRWLVAGHRRAGGVHGRRRPGHGQPPVGHHHREGRGQSGGGHHHRSRQPRHLPRARWGVPVRRPAASVRGRHQVERLRLQPEAHPRDGAEGLPHGHQRQAGPGATGRPRRRDLRPGRRVAGGGADAGTLSCHPSLGRRPGPGEGGGRPADCRRTARRLRRRGRSPLRGLGRGAAIGGAPRLSHPARLFGAGARARRPPSLLHAPLAGRDGAPPGGRPRPAGGDAAGPARELRPAASMGFVGAAEGHSDRRVPRDDRREPPGGTRTGRRRPYHARRPARRGGDPDAAALALGAFGRVPPHERRVGEGAGGHGPRR